MTSSISLSVPLANGYYLHQMDCPEKIQIYPGHKINHTYIYDVIYIDNITRLFYLSKNEIDLSKKTIIFNTENNIIHSMQDKPEIIFCTEHSLSALFFYYKRFYSRKINHTPLILIQTTTLLPFHPAPSKIIVPHLPNHVIAAVPYFDDMNIPSRIASMNLALPGCYEGDLRALLNTQTLRFMTI